MSKRISFYKACAIIVIVVAIFDFLQTIIQAFHSTSGIAESVFHFAGMDGVLTVIKLTIVLFAVLAFAINYMEFSSAKTLIGILDYEEGTRALPMQAPKYAFSPKVYRMYGKVMMVISTVISIALFMASFWMIPVLQAMPLIAFVIMVMVITFVYIMIYNRYKTFADIYEYELSTYKSGKLEEIVDNNVLWQLRGFGIFSVIFSILMAVVSLVVLVLYFSFALFLDTLTNVTMIISLSMSLVLNIVSVARGFYYLDFISIIIKNSEY